MESVNSSQQQSYLVAHEKLIKRVTLSSNELIKLLASHDTLTKKLTCQYLNDRSCKDSELSLLTANLLLKDSNDANPSVRCVSLLALSSLPDIGEAAVSSIFKAMKDNSAQVRRMSALCCINLHDHSPSTFLESGLVDILYKGIRDEDPIVITNCLLALEKTLYLEGSLVINKKIATHLLQNISKFSDSSLVYILNLLITYTTKSEEEMFSILNSLDYCLNSNVASVIIAASQLFFNLIEGYSQLTKDLLHTIKLPICKIIAENIPEINYLIIDYLLTLKINHEEYFAEHYKFFLLRTKDPSYLKKIKLKILPLISNQNSVGEMVCEVKHYVSDFQSFRAAFVCLEDLALINNDSLLSVIQIIASNIIGPNENVIVAALECLLAVSLKQNQLFDNSSLSSILTPNLSNALSTQSLKDNHPELVLRCLQVCSSDLSDITVQDILADFTHQVDSLDLKITKIYISTSAILFLQRPALFQLTLSFILGIALKSTSYPIKSHAAFIYSALEEGPKEAIKLLSVNNLF